MQEYGVNAQWKLQCTQTKRAWLWIIWVHSTNMKLLCFLPMCLWPLCQNVFGTFCQLDSCKCSVTITTWPGTTKQSKNTTWRQNEILDCVLFVCRRMHCHLFSPPCCPNCQCSTESAFWESTNIKREPQTAITVQNVGPIHTGHRTWCAMRHKEMGPVDVNRSVHTARKQHQRKNVRICARVVPVWIGP